MTTDIQLWNTHCVGAYLLWRFVKSYQKEAGMRPNLLMLFPALVLLIIPRFSYYITSRYASLSEYVLSFLDSPGSAKTRSLGGVNSKIASRKEWILKSVELACVTQMLLLDVQTATLSCCKFSETKTMGKYARAFRKYYDHRAETLGLWFARETPANIAGLLGVEF